MFVVTKTIGLIPEGRYFYENFRGDFYHYMTHEEAHSNKYMALYLTPDQVSNMVEKGFLKKESPIDLSITEEDDVYLVHWTSDNNVQGNFLVRAKNYDDVKVLGEYFLRKNYPDFKYNIKIVKYSSKFLDLC